MPGMTISDSVLKLLGNEGAIKASELREWFPEFDRITVDEALTRLLRANKITLALGRYDLVAAAAPGVRKIITATSEPIPSKMPRTTVQVPTAAEEASASLAPATKICRACKNPKPLDAFSRNRHGPLHICRTCHGLAVKKSDDAPGPMTVAPIQPLISSAAPVDSQLDERTASLRENGETMHREAPKDGPRDLGHFNCAGEYRMPPTVDPVLARAQQQKHQLREEIRNAQAQIEQIDGFLEMYRVFAGAPTA